MKSVAAMALALTCGALASGSDVYLLKDGGAARVKVGDVIRVTAAGPGKATAEIEGPGRAEDQNTVTPVVGGKPAPSERYTEIDVRAREKGTIKISVVTKGPAGGKDARTEYVVEVTEKDEVKK